MRVVTQEMENKPDFIEPCTTRFPVTECEHMLPDPEDRGFESERYICKCGRTEKLYYNEMQ